MTTDTNTPTPPPSTGESKTSLLCPCGRVTLIATSALKGVERWRCGKCNGVNDMPKSVSAPQTSSSPHSPPPPTPRPPNVAWLDTERNMSPAQVFGVLSERQFEDVVVLGVTEEGGLTITVSSMTNESLLWYLELAVRRFWDNVDPS